MKPGEPSMTARRVAAHRIAFPRVEAPFGRPDDDQRLQESVAAGVSVDPTTTMARYLRVRTAFMDRAAVDAIVGGTPQVVVVGAGYDGRALRYADPRMRWFELDHPDTQRDKRAWLEELHLADDAIGFAAADFLHDDVGAALATAGHDPSVPTCFLCEGVAAYLPLDVLAGLLVALRGVAAPGSTLEITISIEAPAGAETPTQGGLGRAVAAMGEELRSSLPRAHLTTWFADRGWSVRRAVDPAGVALADSTRGSAFVSAASG